MDSGGIKGLEMRFAFFQGTSRLHHVPAAIAVVRSVSVANPKLRLRTLSPSHPFERSQEVAKKSEPRTQSAMWAYSHGFSRRGVPILINTIPRSAPAASEVQPMRARKDSWRSNREA